MIGEVIGAIASLFIERGEDKERISAFVDAVLAIFFAIVQLNKMEL